MAHTTYRTGHSVNGITPDTQAAADAIQKWISSHKEIMLVSPYGDGLYDLDVAMPVVVHINTEGRDKFYLSDKFSESQLSLFSRIIVLTPDTMTVISAATISTQGAKLFIANKYSPFDREKYIRRNYSDRIAKSVYNFHHHSGWCEACRKIAAEIGERLFGTFYNTFIGGWDESTLRVNVFLHEYSLKGAVQITVDLDSYKKDPSCWNQVMTVRWGKYTFPTIEEMAMHLADKITNRNVS